MSKWEYGHLVFTVEQRLVWGHKKEAFWNGNKLKKDFDLFAFVNDLGASQWELTNTWTIHHEGFRDATVITYVFKRPLAISEAEQKAAYRSLSEAEKAAQRKLTEESRVEEIELRPLFCPDCEGELSFDEVGAACPHCHTEFEYFCDNCYAPVASDAKVCRRCGARL